METVMLRREEVSAYLSRDGALAKRLASSAGGKFEQRESQIELAARVCDVFNDDGIGVFEAGTGVGKSFAYLIPAILWSCANKERVVISTGTINLQEQLISKDIPAALGIVNKDLKAALVKGRQQYVCLRRLAFASAESDLFSDELEELQNIAAWAKKTKDGSRSDLPFPPAQNLWAKINSESDGCMGARCRWREECFVMKARKEAQGAGIVVTNHHLLFADVEMRLQSGAIAGARDGERAGEYAVLPPYDRLVFDEAHGIEDAATSFFSESLTRFSLAKYLTALSVSRGAKQFGALRRLESLLGGGIDCDKAASSIEAVKTAAASFDEAGVGLLGYSYTARLVPGCEIRYERLFNEAVRLLDCLASCLAGFRAILDALDDKLEDGGKIDESLVWETRHCVKRLSDARQFCARFLDWQNHPETVFWLEKNRFAPRAELPRGKNAPRGDAVYARFVQTPLEIASKMNEGVFAPVKSVVCVSATLKTAGSFGYWMTRCGCQIQKDRVTAAEFPSPFPYDEQALFVVPTDAPLPNENGFESFVADAVIRLIEASDGRTLILFTSYETLRASWDAAYSVLSARYTLLRQGDDERTRLLDTFKKDTASVLFATDSFWTGIDVPGESLSQVIIVKLPFSVPTDPVAQARGEALEREGKNPFMELSVPDAIIKFRQGFGRLVRHSEDWGVVAVLDKRIIQKFYGKQFVQSVPKTKRCFAPLGQALDEISRFLGNR